MTKIMPQLFMSLASAIVDPAKTFGLAGKTLTKRAESNSQLQVQQSVSLQQNPQTKSTSNINDDDEFWA
jgi:hypothetical protein